LSHGEYWRLVSAAALGAAGIAALHDLHGAALTATTLLVASIVMCRRWHGMERRPAGRLDGGTNG
jgi:hypothetical protein